MTTAHASLAIDDVIGRTDAVLAAPETALSRDADALAEELLGAAEAVLMRWLIAHGQVPTDGAIEGFPLLALHRQGARGDPSFNACRETCREIVYHRNLIRLEAAEPERARRVRLAAMVVRHLALFVGGKLETAGLGEFCCSSRPLRQSEYSETRTV
ncbi:MAG: hypothetical protein F9K19_14450 [Rhizobiaceae bacterium]|nr:MAG: hypothetical protein F9K19_14450 [Rhizobiaceae bacterium]CAG1014861.1 hypothetical protein RHIZO_04905 [Rhizobiaceae bacterium]